MKSFVLSAAAVSALLVAGLAIQPRSAQGQTLPEFPGDGDGEPPFTGLIAPPAEQLAVTPGGVDMRTGQYHYSTTDLAIGGDGGLTFARTMGLQPWGHLLPFGNLSHNWNLMITEFRVDLATGKYQHLSGQDYRLSVRFGGRSQTFDAEHWNSSSTLVSQGSMAELTFTGTRDGAAVYTYRAADGTIAKFRPMATNECSSQVRCAYLSEIEEPDGTRYSLEYETGAGQAENNVRLRSVTSTRGYALLLEYDGAGSGWHHVSKACVLNLAFVPKPSTNVCPSAAQGTASYLYTFAAGRTRLASATGPDNATASFSYTEPPEGGLRMAFTKPGHSAPWLTNWLFADVTQDWSSKEMVERQDFADGRSYTYEYDEAPFVTQATTGHEIRERAGGQYTDHLGNIVVVRYDFPRYPPSLNRFNSPTGQTQENFGDAHYQLTPGPVEIRDQLNRVTTYDYCDPVIRQSIEQNFPNEQFKCVVSQLNFFVDPGNIRTELSYDAVRNVVEVERIAAQPSSLAPIVTSATYACYSNGVHTPKTCAKPATVTDARQNTTNYTYDPAHGGILSETGPAAPNGVRPQTRYEYAQRYAWISNGAGGYAPASHPVWVLVATSSCRTSAATGNPAAPCALPGDEVRTTYDYGPDSGPNNLWLRGEAVTADGVTLRTCYGYDPLGRRISVTQPNANLSSCS